MTYCDAENGCVMCDRELCGGKRGIEMEQKAKPDIVSFCGVPYEFYCGKCGWLVYTCGSGAPERPKTCRHCGAELDWSEVEVRRKVEQDA